MVFLVMDSDIESIAPASTIIKTKKKNTTLDLSKTWSL